MIAALFCAVTITPLTTIPGLTTLYHIAPVKSCLHGAVARVRKRSFLNAEGPYKPIYPLSGAWTIPVGDFRNEWVGRCWRVEYFDGRQWKAVPQKQALLC